MNSTADEHEGIRRERQPNQPLERNAIAHPFLFSDVAHGVAHLKRWAEEYEHIGGRFFGDSGAIGDEEERDRPAHHALKESAREFRRG